jgi:AcrR family transcriptional regulator
MKKSLPRRKPQQDRGHRRVELILDSTRALLKSRGAHTITTPQIASAAGISVGSIYQYFPNKEAILAALYCAYLDDIKSVFVAFDDEKYLELGWQNFFHKLLTAVFEQESSGDLYESFNVAMALYPELQAIDAMHSEQIVMMIADFMSKLGSRWRKPRRLRLARFLYSLNSGIWQYRYDGDAPVIETNAWQLIAMERVLKEAFE